jgi:hypothetical protein
MCDRIKVFIPATREQEILLYNLRYYRYKDILPSRCDHDNMVMIEDADASGINLAASKGGRIVGSARINWADDPTVAFDRHFFKLDEAPGRDKIAKSALITRVVADDPAVLVPLFKEIACFLWNRNTEYICSVVQLSLPKVKALYERMGFTESPVGVTGDYPDAGPLHVMIMDVSQAMPALYGSFLHSRPSMIAGTSAAVAA